MKVTHLDMNNISALPKDSALLLGTFDGLHTGHLTLVTKAHTLSKHVSVLLIYTNKKVTKAHQVSGVLTTLDDRVERFRKHKVNEVILLNLGDDLLALTADEFVQEILVKLAPQYVVVGSDFRYGKMAKGTSAHLTNYKAFQTVVVEPLFTGNEKISTKLIKDHLIAGRTKEARTLLGDYYALTGLVTRGFGLGNKLGYPTANISVDPAYFLPRHGVYFVRVRIGDTKYFGMASLGFHPTVNEVKLPLLEVNIFDFAENIYHQAITVEFLVYLRPEVKFATIEALVTKIDEDRARCVKLIKEGNY